jgi:hypothetical protein
VPTTAFAADITSFSPSNNSNITVDGRIYWVQNANQSHSLTEPDSDTLRFELRAGDHWSSPEYADPPASERSEIAGTTVYQPGTQISISYDFMIERGQTNSASGPGRFLVLGQMHEDTSTGGPPFAVELVGGDHMAIDIGTRNPMYVYIDPSPIERGHYYSMNIQVKFANNGDGFLKVWRNGVNIVDYQGSIGTGAGTYWKQGVYRSSAKESIAVNFRRLKITAIAMVTGISASLMHGANSGAKTIAVTLHMSQAVTVSGTPILMLGDSRTAVYAVGSGTNALIFSFMVGTGKTNVSLPEVAGVDLPNGAAVKDALGAAANLSIASIARSGLQVDERATDEKSSGGDP